MSFIALFGVIAGSIMIAAYVPQIRMTYRLKKADEISLGLFGMIAVGLSMWIGYGLFVQDYTIVIMNVLLLAANLTIVSMKIIYDRKNKMKVYET